MQVEFVIRGYPSHVRFVDWQRANSLPDDQLTLTPEQRDRARKLQIPERAYAVGIKAAECAGENAVQKMDRVAQSVVDAIRHRYPEDELRSIVWDFVERRFRFVIWHRDLNSEREYSAPPETVDDLLLEKEGAERRLKEQIDSAIGGDILDAMSDGERAQ